jgi:hypothetical protein
MLTPGWIPWGDASNLLGHFAYQYSSFVRGEYPLWNPTVMAGEPIYLFQALLVGNPLVNIVILSSIFFGVGNIVLSHAIYIYILILLYVIGIYLLIFSWTNDRASACFGAMLALFSSTVFFNSYQSAFLVLLHPIPWILFSLTSYFQKREFKYILLLILAVCDALYSYQITYSLTFLFFMALLAIVFYSKNITLKRLKEIRILHVCVLTLALVLIALPQAMIFFEVKGDTFLPSLSRVNEEGFRIKNDYSIDYTLINRKRPESILTRQPESFLTGENCWLAMFTGAYFKPHNRVSSQMETTIKYYIGPVAVPFIFVALFSLGRKEWCVFFSGILVSLLGADKFPVHFIFDLPIFNNMRNLYFLHQYFEFSLIILAALGFKSMKQNPPRHLEKIFVSVSILFFLACFGLPALFPILFAEKGSIILKEYTYSSFALACIVMLFFVILHRFKKEISCAAYTTTILAITLVAGCFANALIPENHKILQGIITKDQNLLKLRKRTDHSLKFRFGRPSKMEEVLLANHTDLSSAHYSNATMTDNSYHHPISNGGFILVKNFLLFRSIIGNELFLSKKFFMFPQVFVSDNGKDMSLFLKQPGLLAKFLNKGIGLSDEAEKITNLGKIDLSKLDDFSDIPQNPDLNIEVQKYNANSMHFRVSNKIAGLFVYTDLWDKNWRVEVDGDPMPLRKVFFTFKGVELKPGMHDVKFFFKSNIEHSLVILNLFFLILLLLLLIMTVFPRKHEIAPAHKIYE